MSDISLKEKYPEFFNSSSDLSCGPGWHLLIDGICRIAEKQKCHFHLFQVKQKFRGLRIHYDTNNLVVKGAIELAEFISFYTCEFCGNKGFSCCKGGWYATMCEDCKEKKGYIENKINIE